MVSEIRSNITMMARLAALCWYRKLLEDCWSTQRSGAIQGGCSGCWSTPLRLPLCHSLKLLAHSYPAKPKHWTSWFVTLFKFTGLFIALRAKSRSKNLDLAHATEPKSGHFRQKLTVGVVAKISRALCARIHHSTYLSWILDTPLEVMHRRCLACLIW